MDSAPFKARCPFSVCLVSPTALEVYNLETASFFSGGGGVARVKQMLSRFCLSREALEDQLTDDPRIHLCLVLICEKYACSVKLLQEHALFYHLDELGMSVQ